MSYNWTIAKQFHRQATTLWNVKKLIYGMLYIFIFAWSACHQPSHIKHLSFTSSLTQAAITVLALNNANLSSKLLQSISVCLKCNPLRCDNSLDFFIHTSLHTLPDLKQCLRNKKWDPFSTLLSSSSCMCEHMPACGYQNPIPVLILICLHCPIHATEWSPEM